MLEHIVDFDFVLCHNICTLRVVMTNFERDPFLNTSTQPPIYYAGGYGYDQARNWGVADHLYGTYGVKTVAPLEDTAPGSANPNFSITHNGRTAEVTRRQALHTIRRHPVDLSVSLYQQDRAEELLTALDQQGHDQVDGIFQSADALNGLLAAREDPRIFRNIVLAYPAGLHRRRQTSTPSVIDGAVTPRRWPLPRHEYDETTHFEAPAESILARYQTLRRTSSYTIGASAILSYEAPVLSEIRRNTDAPNVLLVVGAHDWIMPPNRIIGSLQSASDVDRILVTDTPHGVRGRKATVREILSLFPELEDARRLRESGSDTPPLTERMRFASTVSPAIKDRLLHVASTVGVTLTA